MDQQQIEDAIKSDLITIKTLRLGIVSGRDYYFSILGWIFKLSLLFLGVNTILQRAMHAVGYYLPDLSLKGLLIAWVCALLASTFMSFTAARIILIGKLIKGQLKTASLIKSKYLHFTAVFFLIYSVSYLVVTFPVIGWMDLSDFQQADKEIWFTIFYLAFFQFFSLITASVGTAFISMIELDRLGLGPLFSVARDLIKNKGRLASHSRLEDHE
ncbi:MAG: hypothetical protein A3F46_04250 [Legionellales bacterium RIFCSPHIGHO2_12_FULL_42_9]|nr:MAG: hypothetical protein A3F46_04250 [Legionellales bacterium RIFCSPHIGHO2_12_FULL_42_9]